MSSSNQIFLYIDGGRTLWIPLHKASPQETCPVHLLNFVTPMELSRAFYLFDYPIQLVENRQMAALSPNAKTSQDVIAAVTEFRRVCVEDQNFLLQRCYDANRAPAQQQQPQQAMPIQQAPQLQQQQQPQQGVFGAMGNNAGGASGSEDLLTQLLQRQQQQQSMLMPNSLVGSAGGYQANNQQQNRMPQNNYPAPPTAVNNPMGVMGGNVNNNASAGSGGAGSYLQPPGSMMNSGIPMMGNNFMGVGSGVQPDPFQGSMMMPQNDGGMSMGRGGRRPYNQPGNSFNNNNNMNMPPYGMNPMMMMMGGNHQQQAMMAGMMGGHMQGPNMSGPFNGEARREAEPIDIDVDIPEEVLRTYMNPTQKIVCATMPGPRMTVWLREHEIPDAKKETRYVFCKGGIVLMLKAKGSEVEKSKPVELFAKQICTHFLIYGFCSRGNCLHEHHTEEQLRRLIAARHVQLKAMSKKERHQLVEDIMQKEKVGIEKAEEERQARLKERTEGQASRQAQRQQQQNSAPPADASGILSDDAVLAVTAAAAAAAAAAPAAVNTAISDDEGSDTEGKVTEPTTNAATAVTAAPVAVTAPSTATTAVGKGKPRRRDGKDFKLNAAKLASLGVATDSDDDGQSSSSGSSTSSSSTSSSSDDDEHNNEDEEKKKEEESEESEKAVEKRRSVSPAAATTTTAAAKKSSVSPARKSVEAHTAPESEAEHPHSGSDESDGGEDEEDEEGEGKGKKAAKKPAAKKRGRAAAPKKGTVKRAKK